MAVDLKIGGGKIILEFQAPTSSTILDVKKMIHARLHIDPSRQALTYRSCTLLDGRSLESYGINGDGPVPLTLKVKYTEKMVMLSVHYHQKGTRTVRIKASKTVLELKAEIGRKFSADPRRLVLSYHEKKLKDKYVLSECYITEVAVMEAKEGSKYYDDDDAEETSDEWTEEAEDANEEEEAEVADEEEEAEYADEEEEVEDVGEEEDSYEEDDDEDDN